MNNHFGASRIFSKSRFKVEPDLDNLGADVNDVGAGGGGGSSSAESDKSDPATNDVPTVESLMAELAAEKAKSLKLQNEKDTASSEAANYKKKLREKMTAEEQLDAAKKEQEAAKDALITEYREKEKIRDCTEFLMDSSIGMDKKTAKEFAQKFVEGDFDNAMPILEKHIKAIKDTAYQKALSDRPDPKAGNGNSDENASAMAMAAAYVSRQNGVNMDILNQY